jgi:regulatory protein
MKITAIRQQERLKGRYSLYVDENYAFSLSADALLDSHLVIGQELDEAQLKEYKRLSEDDKAYGLTLAYVVRRIRSRSELRDYFRRKEYGEALAQQILERLERQGFVDDEIFAEAWVRNRRMLKPVSIRRLQAELRQKGVSEEIIEKTLAEDETSEEDVLRELIARRRNQTKYQDDQKLIQYLARQGFGYDAIKAVLREES